MNRALVIGADGLIGGTLVDHLRERGVDVACTSFLPHPGCPHLDLAGGLAGWTPPVVDVAFLCAAVTSLAACAADPAGSAAINVIGTLSAATALLEAGAFVVFLSSNLVLDGSLPLASAQTTRSPKTEYGRQKAAVEAALLGSPSADRVGVMRFTKVLGDRWGLVEGWAADLMAGKPIHPFTGMVVAPVALGRAIDALVEVGMRRLGGVSPAFGLGRSHLYRDRSAPRRALGRPASMVQPVPPVLRLSTYRHRRSSAPRYLLGPAPSPWRRSSRSSAASPPIHRR
ncbi:MAG: sugar nucleotide-binding protein [Dehalococcoidia bacterium]